MFCERDTDPLSADAGRLDTRSRQHCGKFLAAHAPKYIIRAKCSGDYLAELPDYGIADRMTVSIIDCLEPIEVEHHHSNRRAVAPAALQKPPGVFQEGCPVSNAG